MNNSVMDQDCKEFCTTANNVYNPALSADIDLRRDSHAVGISLGILQAKMFNLIKIKNIQIAISIVMLMLFINTNVYSQAKLNATANVRVSLVESLNLRTVQGNLDFGEIIQSGASSNLSITPNKGLLLEVNGSPGKNVFVNYSDVTLNNEQWTNSIGGEKGLMKFSPKVEHTKANMNYSDAAKISSGKAYPLEESSGDGLLYLWVGGKIHIAQSQPLGNYEGQFSVTVSY